jgi:hypothetical protein
VQATATTTSKWKYYLQTPLWDPNTTVAPDLNIRWPKVELNAAKVDYGKRRFLCHTIRQALPMWFQRPSWLPGTRKCNPRSPISETTRIWQGRFPIS